MSNQRHQLASAIVAWLNDPATASSASSPDQLQAAASSLASAFGLDAASSTAPGPGLQTVYEVFLKTQQKMGGAAQEQSSAATGASGSSAKAPGSSAPSADQLKKADELKTAGNKSMSAKDYGAAIASYSQAIDIHQNPIYYSNRAAAFSQIGQHDKAIEDATEAARIDPSFGKAYSRLGHALFSSGKYQEAVDAYQQGLLVDPENKLMQSGLDTAKAQAAKSQPSAGSSDPNQSTAATARNASGDGNAGAGAGAGAGGMGGFPGLGGGGGMPDLASLMNNPMMMQMAQNMMANGGMEQLMNNPMLRSMAERMGGGGGGMPDMSEIQRLMADPNMQNMARQFMGGMGGGAGRGGGAGGSGGNNNNNNNMYG